MKFYYPIFGIFVIFVLWQAYERKKADKLSAKASEDFWQRESDANNVRRKPLDNEDYITIPDEILVETLLPDYQNLSDEESVKELSSINDIPPELFIYVSSPDLYTSSVIFTPPPVTSE